MACATSAEMSKAPPFVSPMKAMPRFSCEAVDAGEVDARRQVRVDGRDRLAVKVPLLSEPSS